MLTKTARMQWETKKQASGLARPTQANKFAPKGLRPPNPPTRVPPTLARCAFAFIANASPRRRGVPVEGLGGGTEIASRRGFNRLQGWGIPLAHYKTPIMRQPMKGLIMPANDLTPALWLYVSDLERSVTFIEMRLELIQPAPTCLALRSARCGSGCANGQSRPGQRPYPKLGALLVPTPEGIEQRIRELAARGVGFSASLMDTPQGRVAQFHDPDGHPTLLLGNARRAGCAGRARTGQARQRPFARRSAPRRGNRRPAHAR